MTISVIICTKDRADDLSRCLNSLYSQSLKPDEILIVDSSCSSETEKNWQEQRGKAGIDLKYIKSKPQLTYQRNLGVTSSCGELLFFFDDDAVIDAKYLEVLRGLFLQYDIGGASGICEDVFSLSRIKKYFSMIFMLRRFDASSNKVQPSGFPAWTYELSGVTEAKCLQGGCAVYRRDVFQDFCFDENILTRAGFEDVDFSYRVSQKYRLLQTPETRIFHKRSQTSRISSQEHFFAITFYHYRFFRKNMDKSFLNLMCFCWSNVGELLRAVLYTIRAKNFLSLRSFFLGTHAALRELANR